MTDIQQPPVRPALQRFVAAGHLRYWIIASWGLALASAVPARAAVGWFALTMAMGVVRTLVEGRRPAPPSAVLTAIATLSCAAWSVAPLLAWTSADALGALLAVVLLCAGYFLVFTQMRAAPREALIVSSPYTAVAVFILAGLWGQPGFWTALAVVPVLGFALLIKVLVTQMKDGELRAVVERQRMLIAELEAARDEANAASRAKSSFLGVISHELRTPMNGVLGAAQLLERSDLATAERRYVDIIRSSGENLLRLLNDLLDMTRMEAGRLELEPEKVSYEAMLERVVGPCASQAEAKGLALTVSSETAPAALRVDPLRLSQVVQNLLSNAIKFTDEGEVRLHIASEALEGERIRMTFTVSDTGAGIAEDDLARLFQPFSQVDASTTRRFGGTGLGLTIARRLARSMNGDVTVRSELGEGSTFTFVAEVEAGALETSPPAAATEAAAAGLRVLIVEDHPVNRTILQAWLTAQGHASAIAADGLEGLKLAETAVFDLILMDVNMPVMDGLTATREIRRRPGPNREAPIVILSASARQEDLTIGLEAGATTYLTKPIEFSRLADVLTLASDRRPVLSPEAFTSDA